MHLSSIEGEISKKEIKKGIRGSWIDGLNVKDFTWLVLCLKYVLFLDIAFVAKSAENTTCVRI